MKEPTRRLYFSSAPAGSEALTLSTIHTLNLCRCEHPDNSSWFIFSLSRPGHRRIYIYLGEVIPPEYLPDLWYTEYLLTSADWDTAEQDVNGLLASLGFQLGDEKDCDNRDRLRHYTLKRLTHPLSLPT